MVIIDFSGVAHAAMYSLPKTAASGNSMDEGLIRHMILNTLRMYNTKFRGKYGQVVIACDNGSWRRKYFPNYKANRRTSREENVSGIDWKEFYRIINLVKSEIMENLPFKVIEVEGAEADDIIATLVQSTQEFGKCEPIMIVSADHDFIQLHVHSNVKQFSPATKKMVSHKNPSFYAFEHIMKGDSGDGVPNVLSGDDTFVVGRRQNALAAKKIDLWWRPKENGETLESLMGEEVYRNYLRNLKMISFLHIPNSVKAAIMSVYESYAVAPKSKVLGYLISKRCPNLAAGASDFF